MAGMDLFTDPRYLPHDEAGRPITDQDELLALHEDVAGRRVGLADVSSPDGRHHVQVSTVFLAEPPALADPKGGPFEMLVRHLEHPGAAPGDELPLRGRYRTRPEATEAHDTMVAALASPGVLASVTDLGPM